jgi:hypothetical protein
MALRDLKQLQQDADALDPEEQLALANYLYAKARTSALKATGNLSEFKGAVDLKLDPVEFQKSIRAEWS